MSQAKPARKEAAPVGALTDGELADEHRGLDLGIHRYKQRQKAIEGEMKRRGRPAYEGERAIASLQMADLGLVDIKRLRADLGPDICRDYLIPGSDRFWRSDDKPK